MIVTLCKAAKQPDIPPHTQKSTPGKKYYNLWVPPKEDRGSGSESNESSEGDDASGKMDQSGASGKTCDNDSANQSIDSPKSSNSLSDNDSPELSGSESNQECNKHEGTTNPRPGQPSVRPNAMKNRQKQLEALLKHEKKFRHSENPLPDPHLGPSMSGRENVQPGPSISPRKAAKTTNVSSLMVLHVLDISDVLESKTVSWKKLNFDNIWVAPEETIFYSLVEGRGELLMFGGIERDIHSLKWDYGIKAHTVNNSLHVLSPIQNLL